MSPSPCTLPLRALPGALLLLCAVAQATPAPGDLLPVVTVQDLDGRTRPLPDDRLPVCVIYEDSGAGNQNTRASDLIDRTTSLPENKSKLEAVPVADLAKWNWWPAKKFATAEMKKITAREKTTIYTDWPATVRKSWRLQKGKSGILLIGADRRVRFAAEGPLSDEQLARLSAAMTALGASVPAPARGPAAVRHEVPEAEKKAPEVP